MQPKALLERMAERFQLLTSSGGRHTRQVTLRATLDWSWDLLSSDEQQALGQLSVFEGGFTLPAAEAVLALEGTWPTDAVQALVDKSLVRRVSSDRFELLVSMQEYAAERLGRFGDPARVAAETRHGAWFARFGTPEAIDSLYIHGGVARVLSLRRDLDNVVVACRRAVARDQGAAAVALLGAAWAVLESSGPFAVGESLAKRVLDLPSLSPHQRVPTWLVLAAALREVGRMDDACTHLDAALALAREVGDRRNECRALTRLGHVHRQQGRIDQARAQYDAALRVARAIGDRELEGNACNGLGVLLREQGAMDEARAQFDVALAVMREVGDSRDESGVLSNLGLLLRDQGRAHEAREHFDLALAVARESGARFTEGLALGNRGTLHVEQGRMKEALADFDAALVVAREVGNRRNEGIQLGNLGVVLRLLGHHERAIHHLAQALALLGEIGAKGGQAYCLAELALVEADAGRHDAALALPLEAVALAAHLPQVHGRTLGALARVHLARAETAAARDAITRARALPTPRQTALFLAAVDALVCAMEGNRAASEVALSEATADPAWCMPGSEVAQLVAHVRRELEALDA
jgi:tetratricopeptide (TPR) repeat protein